MHTPWTVKEGLGIQILPARFNENCPQLLLFWSQSKKGNANLKNFDRFWCKEMEIPKQIYVFVQTWKFPVFFLQNVEFLLLNDKIQSLEFLNFNLNDRPPMLVFNEMWYYSFWNSPICFEDDSNYITTVILLIWNRC